MNTNQLKNTKFPDSPGVYFFLDRQKKPIYIGKATSLRDRVRSYFAKDLISTRGPLLVKMLDDARSIEFRETASVLEALLLEADLIKKFHPIYNTKEKDDKSFLCVVITDEDFPQLLLARKKDIDFTSLSTFNFKLSTVYGPFTSGLQLREALKIVRKIFPYRDNKCHLNSKRPCFNYSIGLCPGICVGLIDKTSYKKRIKNIKKVLSGDIVGVVKDLKKEMNELAKEKKFEEAKILRDKIYALTHIQDISLIKSDLRSANHSPLATSFRIESYDVAHMAGVNMVGVMVVLEDGELVKAEYKKFNIKSHTGANDLASLKEILERRFTHSEWRSPNLIVVDGGQAQLNLVKLIIENLGMNIPVVSVVKDSHHKARGILGDSETSAKYKKEIIFSNAEAHRFAIAFHKKKRTKSFLG
jgi:excinuclease ABC subunit C